MTKFFISLTSDNIAKRAARRLAGKSKSTLGYHKELFYFHDESSIRKLAKVIKPNDTIEFHGHGIPWTIGGEHIDEEKDLRPHNICLYIHRLYEHISKDTPLILDLRTCNSATPALTDNIEICFAKDLACLLNKIGHIHITICGYIGELTSKKKTPLKQFIAKPGKSAKTITLEKGRVTYQAELKGSNSKLSDNRSFDINYNDPEQEKYLLYNLVMNFSILLIKVIICKKINSKSSGSKEINDFINRLRDDSKSLKQLGDSYTLFRKQKYSTTEATDNDLHSSVNGH